MCVRASRIQDRSPIFILPRIETGPTVPFKELYCIRCAENPTSRFEASVLGTDQSQG